MNYNKIVTQLSTLPDSSEIIYAITMQDILTSIVHRIGGAALTLSAEDLQLARDEVQEAILHNLDIRPYIDMGLDSWEIIRKL